MMVGALKKKPHSTNLIIMHMLQENHWNSSMIKGLKFIDTCQNQIRISSFFW